MAYSKSSDVPRWPLISAMWACVAVFLTLMLVGPVTDPGMTVACIFALAAAAIALALVIRKNQIERVNGWVLIGLGSFIILVSSIDFAFRHRNTAPQANTASPGGGNWLRSARRTIPVQPDPAVSLQQHNLQIAEANQRQYEAQVARHAELKREADLRAAQQRATDNARAERQRRNVEGSYGGYGT